MRNHHLVAIAALVGVCSSAFAQNESNILDAYPYGISIRGGIAFPFDTNYSDKANSLIALGGDYTLKRSLVHGGESFISLDYLVKDFQGGRGTVFPLAINQKWFTGHVGESGRSYYFLGAGVSFVDYGSSNTVVSGRAGIGAELGEKIFIEATLFFGDRAQSIRPNAVGAYLGYRF